jgi:hypothetical protein
MKTVLLSFLFLYGSVTMSQTNNRPTNRTFNDSVFVVGDIISIPTINFYLDGNGYENDTTFIKISKFLKKHENVIFELGVHSDSRGAPLKNSELTKYRANSIAEVLIVRFGVSSGQIIPKGYGETKLMVKEVEIKKAKTKEEKELLHERNRRTELKVLSIN